MIYVAAQDLITMVARHIDLPVEVKDLVVYHCAHPWGLIAFTRFKIMYIVLFFTSMQRAASGRKGNG